MSGLQYADYDLGDGPEVTMGSRVNFYWTGRLAGRQGYVFESARDQREPYRITLGESPIIKGLEEGLLGMRQGGKRRLIIPSYLGYTSENVGPFPSSDSQRRRLYSTVFNAVRVDRSTRIELPMHQ